MLVPRNSVELPLGFDMTGHLVNGEAGGFIDRSSREHLVGKRLDRVLATFGIALTTVTISGKIRYVDDAPEMLHDFSESETILGPLDAESLARSIHRMSKSIKDRQGKGNTPPEYYVTRITVSAGDHGPIYETVYIDRKTGAIVERSTWERSRAQLRAAAKRAGRRASTGRYVRARVQVN